MRSAKAQHTAHSVAGGGAPFIISSGMSQFFTTAVGAGIVPAAVPRGGKKKGWNRGNGEGRVMTKALTRDQNVRNKYIKNVTHGREKVESILQTTLKGNQQTSVIHSLTHTVALAHG